MKIETCSIKDLLIIQPKVFSDERGYFYESYNQLKFKELTGLTSTEFIQDNESMSRKGTLRGLHFQIGKMSQSKLVRVISGEVLDVAVDLRKDSSSFGKHFSIILSSENKTQLYIPRGFAHGFLVLSEMAIFSYKVDNYYAKEFERGIRYDDIDLKIDWSNCAQAKIISQKDRELPTFSELNEKDFIFI